LKLEALVPDKPPPKFEPVDFGLTKPPPPMGVLPPIVLLPTDPVDPQVCFGYVLLPPTDRERDTEDDEELLLNHPPDLEEDDLYPPDRDDLKPPDLKPPDLKPLISTFPIATQRQRQRSVFTIFVSRAPATH
jgi:hypothetical protein